MGVALVIFAAFLWGLSGGIGAMLIERGWDPLVASFYRGAIGFVCFAAWWVAHSAKTYRPDWKAVSWSALAGLAVAGNFTFYFLSISHANVAVAATLMYTAPIYVYLASLAIGAVRFSLGFVVAIGSVLLGVALLTELIGSARLDGFSLAGAAAGIVAGMAYAVFLFSFQNAATRTSAVTVLGIAFFVFLLALVPFVDHSQVMAAPVSDDVHLFLLLGLFGAGLSFLFYVLGLRSTPPIAVSLVAAVEPVTASFFGLLVLGQGLGVGQLLGMALILITVSAMSIRDPSARRPRS